MSREQEVPMCMCNDAWHRSNFDNHKHDCDVAVLVVQLRAQLAAAERERDALQKFVALQDAWELEAMGDITALFKERNELRTRAERAELSLRELREFLQNEKMAKLASAQLATAKFGAPMRSTRDGQGA